MKLTMWPRDLLPDSMKQKWKLNGRYSTFGYSAGSKINDGAEYLLAELKSHRLPVCRFVYLSSHQSICMDSSNGHEFLSHR